MKIVGQYGKLMPWLKSQNTTVEETPHYVKLRICRTNLIIKPSKHAEYL